MHTGTDPVTTNRYVTLEYEIRGNDNARRFYDNGAPGYPAEFKTENGSILLSNVNCNPENFLTDGFWDGNRVNLAGNPLYEALFQNEVNDTYGEDYVSIENVYLGQPHGINNAPNESYCAVPGVGNEDRRRTRPAYGIFKCPNRHFASLNDSIQVNVNGQARICLGFDIPPFFTDPLCSGRQDASRVYPERYAGADWAGHLNADSPASRNNVFPGWRSSLTASTPITGDLGAGFDLSIYSINTRDAVPPNFNAPLGTAPCSNFTPGTGGCDWPSRGFGDPLLNAKASVVLTYELNTTPPGGWVYTPTLTGSPPDGSDVSPGQAISVRSDTTNSGNADGLAYDHRFERSINGGPYAVIAANGTQSALASSSTASLSRGDTISATASTGDTYCYRSSITPSEGTNPPLVATNGRKYSNIVCYRVVSTVVIPAADWSATGTATDPTSVIEDGRWNIPTTTFTLAGSGSAFTTGVVAMTCYDPPTPVDIDGDGIPDFFIDNPYTCYTYPNSGPPYDQTVTYTYGIRVYRGATLVHTESEVESSTRSLLTGPRTRNYTIDYSGEGQVGDVVCAFIEIGSARGNNGRPGQHRVIPPYEPGAVLGNYSWETPRPDCATLLEAPLVNIDGSAYAGGSFATTYGSTCPSSPARIKGFTSTSTAAPSFGAFITHAAVATGVISNIGSGVAPTSLPIDPNLFITNNSPAWGNFDHGACLYDYLEVLDDTTSGRPDISAYTGTLPTAVGRYQLIASGDVTLPSFTVPSNVKITLVTDGRVTLTGNITYSTAAVTNAAFLPNMTIIAGSGIDIRSNVTQLDGFYAAGTATSTGVINTCSDYAPGGLVVAGLCENPLLINGVVSASRIHFKRTCGGMIRASSCAGGSRFAELIRDRGDIYIANPVLIGPESQDFRTTNTQDLPPALVN